MSQPSPNEPLPEHWPDRAPVPVQPRPIPGSLAVLAAPLFWVLPKRMGPHFAALSWRTAVVAHLLWVTYGIGCLLIAIDTPRYGWIAYLAGQSPGQLEVSSWPPPTLSEIARGPMALVSLHIASAIRNAEDLILAIGVVGGVELLIVAFAALIMPYAAAGERLFRLHGRCIRLTLWSSTSLIVLGLALQGLYVVSGGKGSRYFGAVVGVYVGWFVWITIRSSLRYAGPQEGPAWEPHLPRCEACGYRLTSLTPRSCCPECGEPIVVSLPERRARTLFAAEHKLRDRVPGYFATAALALFDGEFYTRLAVRHGHDDARRFALWTCLAGGIAIATTLFLLGWLDSVARWVPMLGYFGDQGVTQSFLSIATESIILAAALVLLAGMIAFAASGISRVGIGPCSTVVFYQLVWILPVAVVILMTTACIKVIQTGSPIFKPSRLSPFYGAYQLSLVLAAVTLYSPAILMVAKAGFRAWRGIQQTRYANA